MDPRSLSQATRDRLLGMARFQTRSLLFQATPPRPTSY